MEGEGKDIVEGERLLLQGLAIRRKVSKRLAYASFVGIIAQQTKACDIEDSRPRCRAGVWRGAPRGSEFAQLAWQPEAVPPQGLRRGRTVLQKEP